MKEMGKRKGKRNRTHEPKYCPPSDRIRESQSSEEKWPDVRPLCKCYSMHTRLYCQKTHSWDKKYESSNMYVVTDVNVTQGLSFEINSANKDIRDMILMQKWC
ncbi:hypothetical protein KQX54_018453 [Cotesia glomerata]|uniref:Uncharacterized protein n=1 Tax=Cotesia glomerata TaxID=32391 RepID=A0AAV7IDA1_COTGL|nr:hypothetical protein KQX54_018453 [Cotesia glomerata]